MKKFVVLFFVVILSFSCSSDENYYYEILPINEAIVPDSFEYGKIYEITVKFTRPTDCHLYFDVRYIYDYDTRYVSIISTGVDKDNCEIIDAPGQLTFRVQALQMSDYIFRFWNGDDEEGNPTYIEVIVPVINYSPEKANEFKAPDTWM